MKYVHFTDLPGARAIVKSGKLLASGAPFADAVHAVVEGGAFVPSVQQTKLGRAKNRLIAIVFEASELPDKAFPEEVLWHLPSIDINVIKVLPAQSAAERYLTDTVPRDDETEELDIPLHPVNMNDAGNWIRD